MTPNNVIHELGHSFDNFAGFGKKILGSIENTVATQSLPLGGVNNSRNGMGPAYLRSGTALEFYEHAEIKETSTGSTLFAAKFAPMSGYNPEYDGTEPSGYLLHDIFGENYTLWNSDYNIFRPVVTNNVTSVNMNTRIDTYIHNPEVSYLEKSADAFLNWVRSPEQSGDGLDWYNFLENNIGMFLRNAAAYGNTIIWNYQLRMKITTDSNKMIYGSRVNGFSVRTTPSLTDTNLLGLVELFLPENENGVTIYGWTNQGSTTSVPYWLLVADIWSRLFWVAKEGINHEESKITDENKINDVNFFYPNREFEFEDIAIITGDIIL